MRTFLRQLRHSPQTSLVIVLTLTAAIGFNILSFSFVDAVLLETLPYPRPERLYMLWNSPPEIPIPFLPLSDYNVIDYSRGDHSFESLTAFRIRFRENNRAMILAGENPEWVDVVMTSANVTETLQVSPVLGRAFREGEDRAGAPRVAMLSHAFWRTRFEGSRQILGQKIILNKEPYEVVGVLPSGVYFPVPYQDMGGSFVGTQAQILIPLQLQEEKSAPFTNRSFVRLKADAGPERVRDELQPLTRSFVKNILPNSDLKGMTVLLSPLGEGAVGHLRQPLWGLQAAALLILFIACVNVANLMLSRTVDRERDWAVRTALGASRVRMCLLVVAEGAFLAILAAGTGLAAAAALRNPVLDLASPYIPHLDGVSVGLKEVLFAITLGLLSGLLSSLIPALRLLRISVSERLKDGGRGARVGRGAGWLRQVLVSVQVAVALVVLVAAGLLTRSLSEVENADLGFTNRNILLATANLPENRFPTPEQRTAAVLELQELASGFPGVDGTAVINIAPFTGADTGGVMEVAGRPADAPTILASFRHVSANYFETLGIPLLQGRLLEDSDRAGSKAVAVIDSQLAETYWPGQDPLGERFVYGDDALTFEIVGVAKHMRHDGLQPDQGQEGFVYIPLAQEPKEVVNLLVDSVLPQDSLAPMLRGLIEDLAPEMPVEVRSLSSLIRRANAGFTTPARLSEGMAVLAALLAGVGIYSLIAVMVGARSREIGIRLTLGSRRRQVLALLTRRSLLLVSGGIVAGLVLSWWMGSLYAQTWSRLLYGTSPHDPLTYAGVSVLFLLLALLASLIPSLRALRIDPAKTLREE